MKYRVSRMVMEHISVEANSEEEAIGKALAIHFHEWQSQEQDDDLEVVEEPTPNEEGNGFLQESNCL